MQSVLTLCGPSSDTVSAEVKMSLPIAALLPLAQSPHVPSDLLPPAPASVAILGHLPASAPIHLALAAVASVAQDSDGVAAVDDSIVLILAKSGSEWVSNMLSDGRGGDGDAWFASDGGKARALRKARRVVVSLALPFPRTTQRADGHPFA